MEGQTYITVSMICRHEENPDSSSVLNSLVKGNDKRYRQKKKQLKKASYNNRSLFIIIRDKKSSISDKIQRERKVAAKVADEYLNIQEHDKQQQRQ